MATPGQSEAMDIAAAAAAAAAQDETMDGASDDDLMQDDTTGDDSEEEPEPELTPEEKAAKALEYKQLGNEKYKKGFWGGAIDMYTMAIELAPTEAPYYNNRAACYLNLSRTKDALKDCNMAIKCDPLYIKAVLRGSKCNCLLGHLDEAWDLVNKLKVRLRDNASAKDDELIDDELKRIKRIKADLATCQAAFDNSKYNKAVKLATTLQEDLGQTLQLQLIITECQMHKKLYSEALALINSLYRDHPQNNDVLTIRGELLYRTENVPLSLKHFQQVLRSDPDHKRAGGMFKMLRKLESSKAAGNKAFKEGKNAEAIKLYTTALQVDPANDKWNAVLYNNRAAAHMNMRQYKQAHSDCESSVTLNPSNVKAWLRKQRCNTESEDFQEAVRDAEAVLKLDPDNRDYRKLVREAKLELKKSKRKDHYKILGIAKHASTAEIKKAYRKQALAWHPDRHASKPQEEQDIATAKFKDVTEAYEVLSDATKRRRFDSGADLEEDHMGGGGGQDMGDIFSMFFGGGGGGGMGGMGGGRSRQHHHHHHHH